jgi:type I restriction enzyme M protein
VLFFTKGEPTKKTWIYQLNLNRNLGKSNPLNSGDLAEFLALYTEKSSSENSWTIDIADLDASSTDLSVRNPNTPEAVNDRTVEEILSSLSELEIESSKILKDIKDLLA